MVKYYIKDVEWSFLVLDTKEYTKLHPDTDAVTEVKKHLVTFDAKELSKKLITHELLHVYVKSSCVNSVNNIDAEDMEEICAEILEFHLDDIRKLRDSLWKELKK